MSTSSPASNRLTIALLAGNDGPELMATLASVQGAADEVLVVDLGSCLDTPRIAQAAGAKLVQHPWHDDFAAARNAALEAATGQWVFYVDAGEQLAPEQIGAMRALLALDHGRKQAYLVYLLTPPANAQGAAERIARVRLIPNMPGVRFVGRVHETPATSLIAMGVTIELANITLHRGPIEHDPQHKRDLALRDLHLLDLEIPERGRQPYLLNALAECHMVLQNPQAARQYYAQALRHATHASTEMLESYYGLLTSIDESQHDERMQTCLDALAVFPFDAQLLCAMGTYLQAAGRADLAARAYETAVRFGQINPETSHLPDVAEVAAVCLSTLWQVQGEDEKARGMLRETLERMPNSVRLRRSLIDLEVRYGRVLEALGQAERMPKDFPLREAYRTAIRGACQAARKNWTAALGYLESAYDSGCREPLCLRWLATSLVAEQRGFEAAEVAAEWQKLEPSNAEAIRLVRETAAAAPTPADGRQLRVDPQSAARPTPNAPMGETPSIPAAKKI